jgi:hypothetical protein
VIGIRELTAMLVLQSSLFRYNASLYVPFFWVDDYYITGAVASAANVTYAQLGSLYTISEQVAHTRFMSAKSFYTIMFGHFVSEFMRWTDILLKMCFAVYLAEFVE